MNGKLKPDLANASESSLSYEEMRRQVQSMLPESLDFEDGQNLIELGLDSLQMMRMVSNWRRMGGSVTFAELIASPRFCDWWALLNRDNQAIDTDNNADNHNGPGEPVPTNEPFPLTDVQHAYWIGRRDDQPLGGVGCHAYLELDGNGLEADRLERAWWQVQDHHGSLRTRYLPDGRQELMEQACAGSLTVYDLRHCPEDERQRELSGIRKQLSHRRLEVEKGQVAGLALSLLTEGRSRLHFDIDLLSADVQSLHIVLRDLAAAYARGVEPAAPKNWSFAAYLGREEARRAAELERAAEYWQQRLPGLPSAPGLPLRVRPETVKQPVFSRRSFIVEPEKWELLQKRAAASGVTPAMVLLAAYAEVLDRFSTQSRFLVNIPLFDRQSGEPGIDEVVADFTNLLLLSVDCETSQPFVQRVKDIQSRFHEDVAHAAYSGVQLQRELARLHPGERDFAPVVFACNLGTPLLNGECLNTLGKLGYMISQTPQVWLDFQIYEMDGGLLLSWDSVDELFPEGLLDDMFGALGTLMVWLTGRSNDWSDSVDVLWETERADRAAEVEDGNGTTGLVDASQATRCMGPSEADRAMDASQAVRPIEDSQAVRRIETDQTAQRMEPAAPLHTPFFRMAAMQPEQPAIIDSASGMMWSYGELSRQALRVAAFLLEKGVQRGDAVAVTLPRGLGQVAAVLGILAAGACYVPVGISQPSARRQAIHRKAGIRCVLASSSDENSAAGWHGVEEVLEMEDALAAAPLTEPIEVDAAQLAYIIFTSGSTGEPKGVEISHAAAWNTIADINQRYDVSSSDKMLAVSALDFDLSVYDLFGLLGAGGSLVLIPEERRRDADYWLEQCLRYEITLWNSVPVLLDMLLAAADSSGRTLPSLRLAMLSGDWISLDLPERLQKTADNSGVVAMGGATEASIWSNYYDVSLPLPDSWTSIPYGRPLSNQLYRVVDNKGRDCPDWVSGELWIGGAGVAQGYRGDPELTAGRFVMWNGSRWYRTGDLGRYWPGKIIEFLGRRDDQVKIRGHRIELGEIETALKGHPGVSDAVVTAAEHLPGSKRLIGYVVPDTGGGHFLMDEESVSDEQAQALWSSVLEAGRQRTFQSLPEAVAPDEYARFRELTEQLSARHMLLALQKLGIFNRGDEVYTLDDLIHHGQIQPRYRAMMERWLEELGAGGCVRQHAPGVFGLARAAAVAAEADSECAGSPAQAIAAYLQEVGRSSADLLQGKTDPLEVFFPKDADLSPERLMEAMPGMNMRLGLAGLLIDSAVRQKASQGRLRIIEIGARSSSLTRTMLSCLERRGEDEASYTLTDTSAHFLRGTEKRLGAIGAHVTCQLLDLDRSPMEQGFAAHSYDIVLASDSLHRARNIESSLANVRSLLAPGGLLLALEMTRNSRLQQITTAFLEDGFTRFQDARQMTKQPLLAAEQWKQLLAGKEYTAAALFPGPDEPADVYGMHVIAAQAPARIRRFNPQRLADYLSSRLPDYMLPAVLFPLERLPLNGNGKVNRRALPSPVNWQKTGQAVTETLPRTPVERELADIWFSILGNTDIGASDNFFSLGGDSLLAVKLISRVRERLNIQLPLGSLFEAPTIAGLAERVEALLEAGGHYGDSAGLPQLVPAAGQEHLPFPLTDIQQAYWLGREGVYALGNVSTHCYFEIEGIGLDIMRVEQAWQTLIRQHGMMRAIVLPGGQEQQILQDVPDYRIRVADWRERSAEETEMRLMAVREEMSHQVLAADSWPLFEVRAALLPGDRVRLQISFDNLLFDGWSMFHQLSEWGRLYRNPGGSLPELELSFRDYVLAQEQLKATERYKRDLQYWLDRLDDLPPAPDLVLAQSPESITRQRFCRQDVRLERETWDKLRKEAARAGLSPSGLLLAAYAETLAAWSRNTAFTINLTQFNRLPLHPQVGELVGDFTSLTLLAVDMASGCTFLERARNVQQRLWDDLDHPLVGGVQVQRELARRSGAHTGGSMPIVFTSALGVDNWNEDGEGDRWLGKLVYNITQTPQVWLDHQVVEQDGELLLIWDTVEGLFPEGMLEDMFEAYCKLLLRLAEDERSWQAVRASLIDLPRLEARRRANETAAPLSPDTLDGLFTRQAALRPEQLAVIASGRILTYGELDRLSDEIAALLRERNVLPDTLVAIVMEKGWEQVAAALGILKAGAAYLPLDPSYPKARLHEILEDGGVKVALTQSWIDGGLAWPEGIERLQADRITPGEHAKTAPGSASRPENLAYVIYTSGSTGKPKGVIIDHRGAVNTVLDINRRFGVGCGDRVLSLSSLNFDLSVYDVFGLLAAGAAIILPEAESLRDPARWLAWMEQEQVTLWNTVPAFMQMLLEHACGGAKDTARKPDQQLPQALRLVLLSGDWIPLDLPERIRGLFRNAQVAGLGGATEASIWSNCFVIEDIKSEWKSIPYGYPLANQRYYVLNELLEDCPVWVPGGLYIGGTGLARGYWRDEDKTRERFILHPRTGERLYSTGDKGRYLPDGCLEFLGREDYQVKIRGHRIELGEIEAAMKQLPGVKEAVVLVAGEEAGEQRLTGYVVGQVEQIGQIERIEQVGQIGQIGNLEQMGKDVLDSNPELELFELKSADAETLRRCRQELEAAEQLTMKRLLSAADPEAIAAYRYELESASICAIRDAFIGCGLYTREGERCSQHELMRRMKVQPRYETLLLHWLAALVEDGWLEREPSDMYTAIRPLSREMPAGRAAEVLERHPGLAMKIEQVHRLFRESRASITGLLQGGIEPLELFLEKDTFLTPEALHPYNAAAPFYNELLQALFRTIIHAHHPDKPLRVLEIGTRSGGFADILAPLLPAGRGHHYMYSDESDFFIERARAGHSQADLLEYMRFDMNENPQTQGCEPHLYDVVVADNTLHRAVKIGAMLKHLRQLLAPGGILLFTEAVEDSTLLLTTAGFFEDGFSRFEDERQHRQLPLLPGERWKELLQEAGYRLVGGSPEAELASEIYGQQLFIAQAPETAAHLVPERLGDVLRRRLPDYMVPAALMLLDELPLSANGKVDRKALAALGLRMERPAAKAGVLPVTELQRQLAALWQEVLGCGEPGLEDSFFHMGGDSLRAIQCVNAMKERLGIEMTLQQLFAAPTLGGLAELIEALHEAADKIEYEEGVI
ncbi:amino acid adenylation domain-containing protein [Paenibacillus sp. HN-1]|uniref:non-ribosomal peptide synthetase n=1 Tax=Paenibacillus TaxID=44249 RepID=UPI001CA92F4D|nr:MULTISPECIES: non-ribosomal peptide synthetase [Paenibacillus]MBY9080396.1 amino acid adenylation domain-containing protein [Paenibacillus sp. CGMCC 1.18879]MBY9083976.1 amino acid adenylation domain-containing protein [Paenibacillus sinensis]